MKKPIHAFLNLHGFLDNEKRSQKRGWSSQHWRSPIIKERVQPDRVMWTLSMISLIPEESLLRLMKRFGSKFQKFSKLEVQALVTADLEMWVDNARMRQITSSHASDITKLLQNLVSKGALIQDGQGRWARYALPPLLDSLHMETDSLLNTEAAELIKIAEPARQSRRLSTKEMELILLKLCKRQWLTRRKLAELLERNEESLRSRFLAPMVEHVLLRLRYPEKPNRVDQAYTTTKSKK